MKLLILLGIAVFFGYFLGKNKKEELPQKNSKFDEDQDIIDVEIIEENEEK